MKLSDLSRAQRIILGAAALLLLFLFLPWFGTKDERTPNGILLPARHVTIDVLHPSVGALGWVLLLIALASIAAVIVAIRRRDPGFTAAASLLTAGIATIATFWILYRTIVPLHSTSIRFGIILGLLAAIALTAGALLWMEEEGQRVSTARRRVGEALASARSTPRNYD
ncbi:MAG: hypothetical protein QOG26_488 [Solirubrobacterales bacterium]|nr:hypothetical protein [Solirubrobacterales bacterium]